MTATEWSTLYGGKRKRSANDPDFKDFRRLPIDHCALSLQPWENPYCDEDGNIFDLVHIVPYLKKFKVNPVTGKPFSATQLTKLNVHKNSKGEPHCPVMFKVFNNRLISHNQISLKISLKLMKISSSKDCDTLLDMNEF